MTINQDFTLFDIDNVDIRSKMERKVQNQEGKNSAWRFEKANPMIRCFFKTSDINESSYVKNPTGRSGVLYNYCFPWFILAHLHTCEIIHAKRVLN